MVANRAGREGNWIFLAMPLRGILSSEISNIYVTTVVLRSLCVIPQVCAVKNDKLKKREICMQYVQSDKKLAHKLFTASFLIKSRVENITSLMPEKFYFSVFCTVEWWAR